MITIQDNPQLKREPLDKWSLREQLCLASAVARSGDQNWVSVSRSLKPFGETNRPADWFHQKNCAAQYGSLLGHVDNIRRNKKKTESGAGAVETPAECIVRRLLAERQRELRTFLGEEKAEYKKLQDDMKILQAGTVSEEQLDKWCKEIDEEELKREQEAIKHSNWLKQRDLKKLEIERAWKPPIKTTSPTIGQKRKTSDAGDDSCDMEVDKKSPFQTPDATMQFQQFLTSSPQQNQQRFFQQPQEHQPQEQSKPALSPLLTSLLKSPSQVQNISTAPTSILHCAITGQTVAKPMEPFNISNTVPQPPEYPDFTTQDPSLVNDNSVQPLNADLLDDPNLKIDDLAKSILDEDGPFPEIKKEEVDDIISEIIESSQDLVTDPEQHLQMDGNGEIQISLELDDLESDNVEEEAAKESPPAPPEEPEAAVIEKSPAPVVDPFEFQEDPVIFQSPMKPSSLKQEGGQHTRIYQNSPVKSEEPKKKESVADCVEEKSEVEKHQPQGLVEIVEVAAEKQETEQELNKEQIRDIVHSISENTEKEEPEPVAVKIEPDTREEVSEQELDNEESKSTDYFEAKTKDSNEGSLNPSEEVKDEFADDLYDNINMEVKIDKTGKTKRDYSRPKKRDEKSFDMLLAIEKAHLDDIGISDDGEYKTDKKVRLNSENDRSASPWTEEETSFRRNFQETSSNKRRLSVPGTPIDSLPASPASSVYYEDDRDHRNWKKSVMLVYNRLASNKYASLFLKPITDDQAPGYSAVVYRPMDLQTIKKNIDNGIIRTSLEFKRDVMLMFTNAIMYNKTDGTVFNMTLQMQQESLEPIEILLQAEGQVDVPARRETRTSDISVKRKRLTSDVEPVKNKKAREY